MKYAKYLVMLGMLLIPASYAHAQRVAIGVGIGGPVYGPPVCTYGYYDYYPYACAPYGYYGPEWFSGGFFIGAGPWYRSGYYGRGYYGRGGYYGRPGFSGRGYYGGGYRGGYYGGGYRGGYNGGYRGGAAIRSGGGFHGGAAVRGGGGGFHGGGGSHGGGRR